MRCLNVCTYKVWMRENASGASEFEMSKLRVRRLAIPMKRSQAYVYHFFAFVCIVRRMGDFDHELTIDFEGKCPLDPKIKVATEQSLKGHLTRMLELFIMISCMSKDFKHQ